MDPIISANTTNTNTTTSTNANITTNTTTTSTTINSSTSGGGKRERSPASLSPQSSKKRRLGQSSSDNADDYNNNDNIQNYRWDLLIAESNQRDVLFGELKLDSAEMHLQWCRQPPDGKIAECHYDANWPTKWRFMRFRTDKDAPNHVSIVPKIMQSINEGMEIDELLGDDYLRSVRDNWKRREQERRTKSDK